MAEDTISDLYSKYTSSVEEGIADDRYFQYLFEMVQAGDNTMEQTYRVLHKVVDEAWLSVVEDGLDAIFKIVDKPRRFIKSSEEVVPVALAKKITADSVRHLSQNTQFIGTNAAGEIQPTHILNVTTEESYDLYENRFVYHLIRRLFAFVDKRTDVIFWSTGDETTNVMKMETKVDDAYEQISYKIEMSIKNKQSLVESDADNMDVFKRIDRVRRLSKVLRTSAFCEIMDGCAKVTSPIQRTNLMMKDPDYRTCYKLWQFIESYDEVGYSIEEQDSALEMDEEYMLQMYMNMIGNYTVFKSLIESDPRQMSEIANVTREPVKPKFVKEIKEEIVDNRDIPDVEVRKVFVEEVTEAQLEAEAKLEEETARCAELENSVNQLEYSLSDMQWQMESLSEQLNSMNDIQSQNEETINNLSAELEEEQKAHKVTYNEYEQYKSDSEAKLEALNTEHEETVAALRNENETAIAALENEKEEAITSLKNEHEETIAALKNENETAIAALENEKEEAITSLKNDYESQIADISEDARKRINEAETTVSSLNAKLAQADDDTAKLKARIEELERLLGKSETDAKKQVADITADMETKLATLKADKDTEIANLTASKDAELAALKADKDTEIANLKADTESELARTIAEKDELYKKLEEEKDSEINKIKLDAADEVASVKADAEEKLSSYKQQNSFELEKLRSEADSLRKSAIEARLNEQMALKKAEKNSLSHYILKKIRRKEEDEDSND
ncbi:MAG: hypothetical protein SOW12_09200 [Lachnospiraceae bacterium]|nr:hypothetical protein [Lachnoclostridium sp.]MDY2600087.1 hypothetical protein [Lachnospiraceae bacterium]